MWRLGGKRPTPRLAVVNFTRFYCFLPQVELFLFILCYYLLQTNGMESADGRTNEVVLKVFICFPATLFMKMDYHLVFQTCPRSFSVHSILGIFLVFFRK